METFAYKWSGSLPVEGHFRLGFTSGWGPLLVKARTGSGPKLEVGLKKLTKKCYKSLYPWEYHIIYHFFFLMGVSMLLYLFLIICFFVDFKQTFGISWKIFVVLALFQPFVPFIKFSSKLCTITIIKIQIEVSECISSVKNTNSKNPLTTA